jgi:hypothetical protein
MPFNARKVAAYSLAVAATAAFVFWAMQQRRLSLTCAAGRFSEVYEIDLNTDLWRLISPQNRWIATKRLHEGPRLLTLDNYSYGFATNSVHLVHTFDRATNVMAMTATARQQGYPDQPLPIGDRTCTPGRFTGPAFGLWRPGYQENPGFKGVRRRGSAPDGWFTAPGDGGRPPPR